MTRTHRMIFRVIWHFRLCSLPNKVPSAALHAVGNYAYEQFISATPVVIFKTHVYGHPAGGSYFRLYLPGET